MSKDLDKPLLMIGGPTASGKSSLAIAMAKAFRAEVVNIDSVQVYRQLDIGSAKVGPEEKTGVRHHLLDLWEPDQECNVADYLKLAREAILEIDKRGKRSIVVAGTTMYAPALLHGLAKLPKSDPELRYQLDSYSTKVLFDRLHALDSDRAKRLHSNDRRRIIRALEATILAAQPVSQALQQHGYAELHFPALIVVLCWPRDALYQRIEERAAKMVAFGLLQEVRSVLQCYGTGLRALDSVGYRQAQECLLGRLAREDLVPKIAQYTRQLAKRQLTFWRNEPKKRGWSVLPAELDRNVAVVESNRAKLHMQRQVKDFLAYQLGFLQFLDMVRERLGRPLDKIELWYVNAESLFAEL
jgi:tRNA dimethylallyltransferase